MNKNLKIPLNDDCITKIAIIAGNEQFSYYSCLSDNLSQEIPDEQWKQKSFGGHCECVVTGASLCGWG